MNRKKFIEELAFLLQDIEDAEREEAMQYYEDYFDELVQKMNSRL